MELTILQYLILGIIQGVTEWLPVSSSGMITLTAANFFGITDIGELLHIALFFHIGTFFAALIYFRNDVADLFTSIFNYKKAPKETKNILKFLIIATVITGLIGLPLVKFLDGINLNLTGKAITLIIGIFLLITAFLQLSLKTRGLRTSRNIKNSDSTLLGITQGVSVLPGISRSGITVSTLLLKKFDDTTALRLSFLLSMPAILLGNLLLNIGDIATTFQSASIIGLLAAFIFGLATIHGLMKLSKKINFGWFVLIFAILMMLSVLV